MADDVVAEEEHTELGVLLIDGAVLEVADGETREVVGRVAARARDAMLRDLFEVLTPEATKTHLARVREDLRSRLLQVMGVPSTGKPTLPACEQLLRSLRRANPEEQHLAAHALGDPYVSRVLLSAIEPGERRREALHVLADEAGATILAIALVEIGAYADPQEPWPYAFAIQLATDVVDKPSWQRARRVADALIARLPDVDDATEGERPVEELIADLKARSDPVAASLTRIADHADAFTETLDLSPVRGDLETVLCWQESLDSVWAIVGPGDPVTSDKGLRAAEHAIQQVHQVAEEDRLLSALSGVRGPAHAEPALVLVRDLAARASSGGIEPPGGDPDGEPVDRPALVALARAVECAGPVDSSELKVILGPFTAVYPGIAVEVLLALANGELTFDGPPEDVVPSGEAGTGGEVPDVSDTRAVLGLAPDDPSEATDTGDFPGWTDPSPSGAGEPGDAERSGESEPAGHAAPDDVVEDEKTGDEELEPHEGAGTDDGLPFEWLGRSDSATDADDGDSCPDLTADAPTPTTGIAVADDRPEIQQATEATARPPASALADLDGLVGSALEKGRYGLAAFLASATDQPGARHRAIASLAYAAEMRAPSGGCAAAYLEVVDGLTLDQMSGDRSAQLIALAGALRAAITAPASGAADLLERLRPAFPEVDETVSAFASSARQGVAISDVRAAASDVADAEHLLAEAVATAEERATTVGARNTKFHAATKVWREWVTPGGVLGSLLATASRGSWPSPEERKRNADELRAQVTDLRSERSFKRHMDEADRRVQNRYEIEAGARETLRNWWNDVLDTVERWIEAVHVLDEAVARNLGVWQLPAIHKLKDALNDDSTALEQLTTGGALDEDPVLRGATSAAEALVQSVHELLGGQSADGAEADAPQVLHRDLLALPAVRLDEDWSVVEPLPDTHALDITLVAEQSASSLSAGPIDALASATKARLQAEDFVGSGLIIELLSASADERAEQLRTDHEIALATSRRQVTELWQSTNDLLSHDRRAGYLDEGAWRDRSQELNDLEPSSRRDLGVIRRRLVGIAEQSEQDRVQAKARFRASLEDAARENRAVAEAYDRIVARLEDGDLATAEEYLSRLLDGERLPEPSPLPEGIGAFYPDADGALQELPVGRRFVAAVRDGERWGPVTFAGLAEADRDTVVRAAEAWRQLGAMRRGPSDQTDWRGLLAPILRLLGCEARSVRLSANNAPGANGQYWLDLEDVRHDGRALVPAYSSETGIVTTRRLLIVTESPAVDLLDSALARNRSEEPTIVFHTGPAGPHKRRRVADAFRRSHRAVAFIDDAVLAWIASRGGRRYETTMRTVLPFVTTNPYQPDVAGLVSETMFYGREVERRQILAPEGSCYLYGGRQFGKSALLRSAARQHEDGRANRAIYLDLKGLSIGRATPPAAIWEALWRPLVQIGIVQGDPPLRGLADVVTHAIEDWLSDDPARRLLILLDECDNMLEADAAHGLTTSARLKELMERTTRRCKVVFAGLHTVQRFVGVQNTPFAHMGTPLAVGPLDSSSAAKLVTDPMYALGYRFADPELVSRILAHTNNQPALVVLFMHHLVARLQARPSHPGTPPVEVTAEDVDSTWADPTVQAAMRARVEYTLKLDPAYHVIAHVVAWITHNEGARARIPARRLREECAYWWRAGFEGMSTDRFRLLADELIGLGILSSAEGGYVLRSPNVARLLGSPGEIEEVLEEAHTLEPEGRFEPSEWRRPLELQDGRTLLVRSPLSDVQLQDLIAPQIQARLVIGSAANGVDRVMAAIRGAVGPRVPIAERAWNDPNIRALAKPLGDGRHRVAVVDLKGSDTRSALALIEDVREAVSPLHGRDPRAGTFGVVLVGGPTEAQIHRAVAGSDELSNLVVPAALTPWSRAALKNWAHDAGLPFDSDQAAGELAQQSGGWDLLVRAAVHAIGGAHTLDRAWAAISEIHDDPGRLERAAGALDGDPVVSATWELAAEVAVEPLDRKDLGEFLVEDATVHSAAGQVVSRSGVGVDLEPASLVDTLLWLGLLVEDAAGVHAEPVLLESRRRRRAHNV